jgi:hypothetical protein
MRDQALFDKIDLHLDKGPAHRVDRTQRLESRHPPGHAPAGGERALKRCATRRGPASGALRRRHGAHRRRLAHARAQRKHSSCRRVDVFRRARVRAQQRAPDLPRAASDYLDPLFLPQLVAQIKQQAPHCGIEILPLSAESDYRARWRRATWMWSLATGSSRRTTCTWAACSATRWSAWWHATTRPCAAQPGWLGCGQLAGGRAHRAHAHAPGRARRDRRAPRLAWACSATSRRAARISA